MFRIETQAQKTDVAGYKAGNAQRSVNESTETFYQGYQIKIEALILLSVTKE
jgi:hypothetical protein